MEILASAPMDWIQFAIMFVTFVGLFIWNRTESRADIRHMDTKLESNRNLTISFYNAVQQEMKDFHIRLEKQDSEFKLRMERQDADFKTFLMSKERR